MLRNAHLPAASSTLCHGDVTTIRKRSTLGALALLLATSSLAQTLPPDDPPVGGGTSGSGGGTGGTGGTGGSGSGGGTGGSGTPSWPYGSWILQSFTPNGHWRYITPGYTSPLFPWPLGRPSDMLRFEEEMLSPGTILVTASPTARLLWLGQPDMYPTQLHVRLRPEGLAHVTYGPQPFSINADVGRYQTVYNENNAFWIRATGPLYKKISPSLALADVPAIQMFASASSDFPDKILGIKAVYDWEVLPPLLISQLRVDTQQPILNYRKASDGTQELSPRDRNGKQVLHVSMQLGQGGMLRGRWFLSARLSTSYGSFADPSLYIYGGSASTYQTSLDSVFDNEGKKNIECL